MLSVLCFAETKNVVFWNDTDCKSAPALRKQNNFTPELLLRTSKKYVMQKYSYVSLLFLFSLIFGCSVNKEFNYKNIQKAYRNPDNVVSLDFSKSGIKSLPDDISRFSNLKLVNISYNELDSFPPELLECEKLEVIIMIRCNLIEIPADIDQLKELKDVTLTHNKLESLPRSIGNLKNLRLLYIADNWFSEPELDKIHSIVNDSCKIIDRF